MYDRHKVLGTRNCSFCGKKFNVYNKKRLEKENVCCSVKCLSEYRKKQNLNCKCAVCGKMFHRKPSSVAKAVQPLTCSRVCLGKLRASIYKGDLNPNFGNKGSKNPLFKGGVTEHSKYLWEYAPNHPFAPLGASHRVRKHRLIAEQYLLTEDNSVEIDGKRYLKPEYDIHHIDRNKYNNEPNNLQVVTRSEHAKIHALEKLHPISKYNKGEKRSTGK